MLMKLCRCGTPIEQGKSVCDKCRASGQTQGMRYNKTRDKKSVAFYTSREWRRIRELAIRLHDGIDVYAWVTEKRMIPSEHVHHIVELEEDWSKRLNLYNLIPLSQATHNAVTAIYSKSERERLTLQKELIKARDTYFEGAGGYSEVLSKSGIVCPLFILEKTPHEGFSKKIWIPKELL